MTRMPQSADDLNPLAMLEVSRVVAGGVDTHKELHVAAVIDTGGTVLGTHSFSTTRAGYRALIRWIRSFGDVRRVGVEGTGSYGAGVTRHLRDAGIEVLEGTGRIVRTAAATARTTTSTRSAPPARRCTTSARRRRSQRTARCSHCACCG